MRVPTILFILCLCVLLPSTVTGKTFKNEDTAKNRHNYNWGTRNKNCTQKFEQNQYGDSTWGNEPCAQQEAKDWSEKCTLTINPELNYNSQSSTDKRIKTLSTCCS